jgi:peptidoglycan/xylan/chitin deacetylase (PgdA/CDA1 family)
VELADPPPGAEALLGDALPSSATSTQAVAPGEPPPLLAELPPITRVSAEVVSRPEKAGRKVALTFDACSTLDRSFYDERVIAALRAARAPATLFVSGRWAETHVAQVRALAREPLFEIANHSYIHPHMTEVSPERQREELLWTQQILLSLTGKLPRFFRPPYGELDAEVAQVAAEAGLRTVEYDFPSGDPDKHITKERLIAWVLAKARPGSIVVMHMNRHGWHTAEALPEILSGLRAKGFTLATVGELVDADAAAP